MKLSRMLLFAAFSFLSACATQAPVTGPGPVEEKPPVSPTPTPEKPQEPPPVKRLALSWEIPEKPERKAWSDELIALVRQYQPIFENTSDIPGGFVPGYSKMNQQCKEKGIAETIIGVIYFESGYKPTSWMTETTMSTDPVTGKQVKSEGLLQLSYQDVPNYASIIPGFRDICKIDWSKDKGLAQDDPKKTIFNPIINLRCGVRIMAYQAGRKGSISYTTGNYWAVLKADGKYGKVASIKQRVKDRMVGCL